MLFLSAAGKCPSVPTTACAMMWDKDDCGVGNWGAPYIVKEFKKNKGETFGILSSQRNDANSVSIRRGCTLTVRE